MPRPSDRQAAIGLALLAGAIVYAIAILVFPHHSYNHDEAVYLQQAEMLRAGQLSLDPPVAEVFRPWFFIVEDGRLYPKYTPVFAGLFAMGGLVGDPRLALAGIAVGICYLVWAVTTEVFDRRTGLVAAAFVLGSPMFLIDAAVFLPYAPMTLLNLVFALGYLRADRTGRRRWAIVAGAAIGLAFFARPYTAVLFAIPFIAHAVWRLRQFDRPIVDNQVLIAGFGLAGVTIALGYNARVTGSPFLFPYEAFDPLDGLGFGRRSLLAYEVAYTPRLALRANAMVLVEYLTRWIAAGPIGTLLAGTGLASLVVSARRSDHADPAYRRLLARRAILAGLFLTIPIGNVFFWGNFNILGELANPADGFIRYFGPFYHFDLVVPTAVFAGVGARRSSQWLQSALRERVGDHRGRSLGLATLVVAGTMVGGVAGAAIVPPLQDNYAATQELESAYEPFADGPPSNAIVFLPTPQGPWLNHPFQALRNDPNYEGATLYALDERPFAVVDAYPDRRYYRYAYRGAWIPVAGGPVTPRLQPIRAVSGDRVEWHSVVGNPHQGAVSIRLATERDQAYYTVRGHPERVTSVLTIANGTASLAGPAIVPVNETTERVPIGETDTVRLEIFVDNRPTSAFSYRIDMPVERANAQVRAVTPRLAVCREPHLCPEESAYIPSAVAGGVYLRSTLVARNATT